MRNIAVIGLGKFGSTVATELTEQGVQVIAIDENRERVEEIKDSVAYAACLNTTDRDALVAVNIQEVDVAIVCIGEDIEANLLTTLLLKKIGVKKIWARAISPLQSEILKTLEVDQIISLEEEMGRTVAHGLASANISKQIPLAEGHSIAEIRVPASFVGKTLRQIDPRRRFNVNVVAIKRLVPAIDNLGERTFKETIEQVPSPDKPLAEDDLLLVAGSDDDLDTFSRK
jgi:trk system potassium uptake protein TrkA